MEFIACAVVNCGAQNFSILSGMYVNPAMVQMIDFTKILFIYMGDKILFKTEFEAL